MPSASIQDVVERLDAVLDPMRFEACSLSASRTSRPCFIVFSNQQDFGPRDCLRFMSDL